MSDDLRPGIFREVNDRIAEITGTWQWEDKQGFLCECAAGRCTQAVWMTRAEYEAIRADKTRFFIVPGHERPGDARLVERHETYLVIESVADGKHAGAKPAAARRPSSAGVTAVPHPRL